MSRCINCGTDVSDAAKFCPSCGTPISPAAAPLEQPFTKPASTPRKVAMFVFPIVLLAGIGVFIKYLNPAVHPVIKNQPVVSEGQDYGAAPVVMTTVSFTEVGNDLVFSLDELKKHRLVRFEYLGGKTPRWVMAYVAPNGQLVTAMSISEHCGSTEFTIKENKIFCARCPSNWDMMTMEAYACCAKYFPDPIPSRVEGNFVRVEKATVEGWAGRL